MHFLNIYQNEEQYQQQKLDLLDMFTSTSHKKKKNRETVSIPADVAFGNEELYNKGVTVLKNIQALARQYEQDIARLNEEAELLEIQNILDGVQDPKTILQQEMTPYTSSYTPYSGQKNIGYTIDTSPVVYTMNASSGGLSIGICADRNYHAKPMNESNLKEPWYIPIYYIYPDTVDIGIGSILIAANSPKLKTCSCIAQYTSKNGAHCTVCTSNNGVATLAYVSHGSARDCKSGAKPAHNEHSLHTTKESEKKSVLYKRYAYGNGKSRQYTTVQNNTHTSSIIAQAQRVGHTDQTYDMYTFDTDFETALNTSEKEDNMHHTTLFGSFRDFIHALYTHTIGVFY